MRKYLFVGMISLLLFASITLAQIPEYISVQGILSDPVSGEALSGSYNLRFEFYDQYVGGTLEDTVIVNDVDVVEGLFNVEIPPNLEFDEPYYINVSVQDEGVWYYLSPRINLTSVAYSYSAGRLLPTNYDITPAVDGTYDLGNFSHRWDNLYLGGEPGSAASGSGFINDVFRINSPSGEDMWIGLMDATRSIGFYDYGNDWAIFNYSGTIGDVDFWRDLDMNGNSICLTNGCESSWPTVIGGSGTDNYLAKWTLGGSSLTDSIIYDNGNIGIGTDSPGGKLEIESSGGFVTYLKIDDTSANGDTLIKLDGAGIGVGSYFIHAQSSGSDRFWVKGDGTGSFSGTVDVGGITEGGSDTLSNDISGNAATATALAADGTNCAAGQYARGVDASGNAQGCTSDVDTDTNAKTLCADGKFLRGEGTTTCRSASEIVSDGGGKQVSTFQFWWNPPSTAAGETSSTAFGSTYDKVVIGIKPPATSGIVGEYWAEVHYDSWEGTVNGHLYFESWVGTQDPPGGTWTIYYINP